MGTSYDSEISVSPHRLSLGEKFFFFLSGVITSVPLTLFVGTFTDSLCIVLPMGFATICSVALFTPFVEEFAKAYPLFYRHGETERSIFSLGFLVGLGFGFTEFLLYVIVLQGSFLVRLPGIFFHAASTSITAYGIGKKKAWIFYLVAVGLHFANNIAALFDPLWVVVAPFVVIITYWCSWYLYQKTSERYIDEKQPHPSVWKETESFNSMGGGVGC
jgi:RsiW-degrading membrane proteinase PrsW (M82 family)